MVYPVKLKVEGDMCDILCYSSSDECSTPDSSVSQRMGGGPKVYRSPHHSPWSRVFVNISIY